MSLLVTLVEKVELGLPRLYQSRRLLLYPVLVAAIVFAALGLFVVKWHPFDAGAYGSWLQGTLTPLALLLAVLTFRESQAGRQEQTAALAQSNRMMARTMFLSNLERFHGHLDYLGSCAIMDRRLSENEHRNLAENKRGYGRLFEVLEFSGSPTSDLRPGEARYQNLIQGTYLREFRKDLAVVVKLAEEAEMSFLLDRRLLNLHQRFSGMTGWDD